MCICGVCMQNAQLGGNMYYIGVDLGTSAEAEERRVVLPFCDGKYGIWK